MNAFTTAAEAVEEVVTPAEPVTKSHLVSLFLHGRDGTSGTFTSVGGNLYNGDTVIARRCPTGRRILMAENPISDVELSDALVGGIALNGNQLRRVKNFTSLTSASDRVADLKAGNFENFDAIASLFGFVYSEEDIAAVIRSAEFIKRTEDFFRKLATEEADRVRSAEEKARSERAAKEGIEWDKGIVPARNTTVHGAGGGQRMRVKKGATRYPSLETSTGHTTTLRQAKKAFDFASKYWHGGKSYNSGWGQETSMVVGSYPNQRKTVVTNAHLKFGCQSVSRKEAERFADVMGWARAVPA